MIERKRLDQAADMVDGTKGIRKRLPLMKEVAGTVAPSEVRQGKILHVIREIQEHLISTRGYVAGRLISGPSPDVYAFVSAPVKPLPKQDLSNVVWVPELAGMENPPKGTPVDDMLAVNEWFRNGGRDAALVTFRERSLEIFGNEKRIDALKKMSSVRKLGVDFALLRCEHHFEPLAFRRGPEGTFSKPCLVVENSATFRALEKFNGYARLWSSVVYGAGGGFTASWQDLFHNTDIPSFDRVEYFGDADDKGLFIPFSACRSMEGIRDLVLCPWLYRLMETVCRDLPLPENGGTSYDEKHLAWAGDLRGLFEATVRTKKRLPQEAVTFPKLMDHLEMYGEDIEKG